MKIAYFINAREIHSLKWIAEVCKTQEVLIFTHFSYKNIINNLLEEFNINADIYYLLPDRYSLFRFFIKQKIKRQIKKILDKEKVDIVHSMFIEPYSFYAAETGLKHVITTRGSDLLVLYNKKEHSFYLRLIRILLNMKYRSAIKKAAYIICTSDAQKEKVLEICKCEEKVEVIPTGISLSLFNHETKFILPFKKTENEFYLFCPRAWRKLYNIDLLAEAVIYINENHNLSKKVVLVLLEFGVDQHYKQVIMEKINTKPEYFKVFPAVPMSDMPAFYAACDAVIMIPESDGTPNSALEAFAMKKPVVLGKASYDPAFFNPKTAFFIKEHTKEAIANGIYSVFYSPERELIIENAFNIFIQKATLQNSIEKIVAIYEKIQAK